MEDGVENFGRREFGERALAGGHFVKDEACGVKIGAGVEISAKKLLGGHVGERAGERVGFKFRLSDRFGEGDAKTGEAEIEDFEAAVIREDEIGGLKVAMNDGVIVGSDEAFGELKRERKEGGFGKRAGSETVAERLAGNEFHDEEIGAALGIEIVDGSDVGMIELREGASFVVEAMARGIVGDGAGMQELDGNVTVEVRIASEVDDTHAATTYFAFNAVVTELEANKRILCRDLGRHREAFPDSRS